MYRIYAFQNSVHITHILSKKRFYVKKAEENSKRFAPENPGKISLFLRILKNDKIEHTFALFDVFVGQNSFN